MEDNLVNVRPIQSVKRACDSKGRDRNKESCSPRATGLLRVSLFMCAHVHSHRPLLPLFPSEGQMPEEPTEVYLPSKPAWRGLAHRAVPFPWESLSLPSPQCLPFIPVLGVGIPTDTQTVMPTRPEDGNLWADLRCHTLCPCYPHPHAIRPV